MELRIPVVRRFGERMTATRKIEQSPFSDAPAIPRGAVGSLEDEDAPWLLVDFGEPYGVVICDKRDVR